LVLGIALIEVGRWVWPGEQPDWLPSVHLAAISWAIGLLLIYELIEMAFAIAKSVAKSVTRYLQLYALVLLRDAFLKLESFPEPIKVHLDDLETIGVMMSDAGGSLLLFAAAAVFERLQRHTPITKDAIDSGRFRVLKQAIVMLLLAILGTLCVLWVLGAVGLIPSVQMLGTFFTVLVFVDVLLAFISLAFTTNPAIVFRNFGFAFSAIILRLALASPEFVRPGLCVGGAVIAIAMTLVYNFATDTHGNPPASKIPEAAEAEGDDAKSEPI
jgi:hypothetical protein